MSAHKPAVWPLLLSALCLIKEQIVTRKPDAHIGFSMPKVKALPNEIRTAEQRIGLLPPDLAAFLYHANGWPSVYFSLDLLAVGDFLSGEDAIAIDDVLGSYVEAEALPVNFRNTIVVGSSSTMADRVLVVTHADGDYPAGTTFWLDEESVESYNNFRDFFAGLVAEHESYLASLSSESST